jgi:uncharacterized SAM-binding protein YcdF (DUF218 family)
MFRGVELIEIGGCTHIANHLSSGSHGEQGTGLTTLTEYKGDLLEWLSNEQGCLGALLADYETGEPDLSAAHGVAVFGTSVDRIIAAAVLARRYPNARIAFSGGNANLVSSDAAKEADFAMPVFESFGFAKDRLIMERRSRNTYENAEFSKALVSPNSGERWLLVTSAHHMPRSVGIFRKVGFEVEPYPVDWRTGRGGDLLKFSDHFAERLALVDTAAREWMGLLAYWITGKTGELFPGPKRR